LLDGLCKPLQPVIPNVAIIIAIGKKRVVFIPFSSPSCSKKMLLITCWPAARAISPDQQNTYQRAGAAQVVPGPRFCLKIKMIFFGKISRDLAAGLTVGWLVS
jgi:hypothetical protein